MSYAAAITWEMDGFRLVRSRPRREAAMARSGVVSGAAAQVRRPAVLPRQGGATSGMGTADRLRGAERALEADWQIVVQRCLDGDSGAWTELVKAHHRRVYALCYRFTGSTP